MCRKVLFLGLDVHNAYVIYIFTLYLFSAAEHVLHGKALQK